MSKNLCLTLSQFIWTHKIIRINCCMNWCWFDVISLHCGITIRYIYRNMRVSILVLFCVCLVTRIGKFPCKFICDLWHTDRACKNFRRIQTWYRFLCLCVLVRKSSRQHISRKISHSLFIQSIKHITSDLRHCPFKFLSYVECHRYHLL